MLTGIMPDMIDNKTQEIKAANEDTYSDMRDVGDELPDSSPRFILLSYPLTLVSCNWTTFFAIEPGILSSRICP